MSELLWGVDLGGTKIEAAVAEIVEDRIVTHARMRVPTEAHLGYEAVVAKIVDLIDLLKAQLNREPNHIGVGGPGAINPATGRIMGSNTQCLNGRPLREDLASALGKPVALTNDANCFALAEARFGAGRGHPVVFGVILGTGVGGGIVVDGKPLPGLQGIAGEWGHNPLDPEGELCPCGRRGCVELTISGPRLEAWYEQASGRPGGNLGLAEIVQRARAGNDRHAMATLDRLTTNLGRALAVVVNILDPDVIIVGGGVGNVDELYEAGAAQVRANMFAEHPQVRLVRPMLGDSAGVFGAALLDDGAARGT